ncbi:phosphoenolpyruvate hydrolase family protein [Hwanghaeella sp.]|uniref:phosphoenolpyruvate hydrolase family protein n=1 Tax=Hwanghaeella sp. TaxID=2605943 RepID=UPI003CCBC89D
MRKQLKRKGKFLIGAAIGSGSTGLAAERGGADFLLAINAGRLRSMGAPSIACMLPIFDARSLTDGFARTELLTQCRIPVLIGLNVWEAELDFSATAAAIAEQGFAGAVNFPSCMHYSRPMQQILSRAGRGIEREVEQLRAVQDQGLTAMFYCATRTQARLAADAGLDMVCLNLGWNVGGSVGHRARASLEEAAAMAREIGRLVKRINPKTRFLVEGGPIETAEDLTQVIRLADIDGYVGGSTFERMPLEIAVADQIDRFRQASSKGAALDDKENRLTAWGRGIGFRGRSPALIHYLDRLKQMADLNRPVLLLAEKGSPTQPSLTALAGVSAAGKTGKGPVVTIDLAGEEFPGRARNLLFGHRDTIDKRLPGLSDPGIGVLAIRAAERLPVATQRRLARALMDGTFRAPGSWRPVPVSTRVVLVCEAAGGGGDIDPAALGFDPQLIEALGGAVLTVPPLRERIEDLFDCVETGLPMSRQDFTASALRRLEAHAWPGNEAELAALLTDLAADRQRGPIAEDAVLGRLEDTDTAVPTARGEKERILDALWRNGFNRTRTAEALGVSRKTLYNKIQKYGLTG